MDGIATIIASIIGVIGVIITVTFSFYNVRKNIYANTITKERAKWLSDFRNEIAVLFRAFDIDEYIESSDRAKIIAEANGAKAAIISRLRENNAKGNKYNKETKKILSKNIWNIDSDDINVLRKNFNIILEREWDKTKEECKTDLDRFNLYFVFLIICDFVFLILLTIYFFVLALGYIKIFDVGSILLLCFLIIALFLFVIFTIIENRKFNVFKIANFLNENDFESISIDIDCLFHKSRNFVIKRESKNLLVTLNFKNNLNSKYKKFIHIIIKLKKGTDIMCTVDWCVKNGLFVSPNEAVYIGRNFAKEYSKYGCVLKKVNNDGRKHGAVDSKNLTHYIKK